jgi:hypothetical protein
MHSLTSALDGDEWSALCPSHFKSPQHPVDVRLGGAQSWYGHGVKENNSQPPPGIEPQSSGP